MKFTKRERFCGAFQEDKEDRRTPDGELEAGVQSGQTAQLTWIPATGTRDKGAFTGNKQLRYSL
jgi:hypothetical protein